MVDSTTIADWYKDSNLRAPTVGLTQTAPTAAPQVQTPNVMNVATIDSSQFDPNTAVKSTMTPSLATTTNWNVDAPQTVAGQVKGLVDENSPLMQQAATNSLQQMQSRGLANSSMAVGAGQQAVINTALPIAQQDATTFGSAARRNADAADTTSQFNATSKNTASQVNTTQQNALQSQMYQQRGTIEQANAAAKNNATALQGQLSLSAQTANQSAAVQQASQAYDGALKVALANADAQGKLQLAQMDAAVKTNLAEIQAKYNVQMQTSGSMANTYQSYINQVGAIMADPNLDAAGKQTAINNLNTMMNNSMAMQSSISGLNLGSLINPDTFGVPTSKDATIGTPTAGTAGFNQQGVQQVLGPPVESGYIPYQETPGGGGGGD